MPGSAPPRSPGAPFVSGPGLEPWERIAATALVAGAAVSLLLWTTGQLAARVTAGRWAPIAPTDMPATLLALPNTLDNPAAAFPESAAGLLPAAVGFWTAAAAVTLTLLAVTVLVVKTWSFAGRVLANDDSSAATWARARDLRALTVRAPMAGRLTLGTSGGRLLAAEASQAVIVLGPARSGKTTGLAIPALLEWDGPVIATSVRTDLVDATLVSRRRRGRVWVYDPSGTAGSRHRAGWNPLTGCHSWAGAQRTAAWLCDAGRHGAGMGDEDFWLAVAAKLLAPILFAAARGGWTMAAVLHCVDTQDEPSVRSQLLRIGDPAPLAAAQASWQREPRTKSSAYTTAEVVLRAFADPAVLATIDRADLTADALLDGGAHTLYVCAPSHEQERLQPLFAALLQQVITAAYERAAAGQPLTRPLLILLDEAANIAPLRNLDTLASTAAGTGIQLLSVWQDLAQIDNRYGRRAATVVNNHRAKLLLSGISDEATLRYVSTLAGDAEQTRASVSTDSTGRRSTSSATMFRPLAGPNALRQIAPNEGLLVYGHLPPARLRLRPWYADRRLRRLADTRPKRARS